MSGENKAEISILPSSGITSLRTDGVNWIAVGPDADGQRVDNYLARVAKGVPKSHIYRIIRAGEVRVNKARVKAETEARRGRPAARASDQDFILRSPRRQACGRAPC